MVDVGEVAVVYATYHVDVGETPFFVAVDYSKHKVVVSIRGTLSLQVSHNLCLVHLLLVGDRLFFQSE